MADEVFQPRGERCHRRRPKRQAGGKRLKPIGEFKLHRLVEHAGPHGRLDAVGRVHRGRHLPVQRVPLIFEYQPCRQPAGGRDVRRILIKTRAAEDVLKDRQSAEIVERALREEGRHPHECLARSPLLPERIERGKVIPRRMVVPIKREVDHELPVVTVVGELVHAHFPHVRKEQAGFPLNASPLERMVVLEKSRLVDAERLLEDDLADHLHAVAVAIFRAGPIDDVIGVDVGELNRHGGVAGVSSKLNFADLTGPFLEQTGDGLCFLSENRCRDRAVVEGGQPGGGHPPEALDVGHERRQK